MAFSSGEVDVVVVGSGGAGLAAALAAGVAGASVAVLEASGRFGGTTAVSGGQVWVPANHRMAELGVDDSVEEALEYCLGAAPRRDAAVVEAFVRGGREMVRFVEAHTPIAFTSMQLPDTYAERPGGKPRGRHLEVAPLPVGEDSPWQAVVWGPPYPPVVTNDEVFGTGMHAMPVKMPYELFGERMAAGVVTQGVGLVLGLIHGCRAAGVELVAGCEVRGLLRDGSAVSGVTGVHHGRGFELRARRGVVLSAGGFEWDPELAARLLAVPLAHAVSPPLNRGTALRLAAGAGAELAYVGESWAWPVTAVPGERWDDGSPRARLVIAERTLPHVLWVNRAGERFVDEASHNCALAFGEVDPATHMPRNVPAFAIGDAQYRARYTVAGVMPDQPAPPWLAEADSLAKLAAAVGVDPHGLERSVGRFNDLARAGRDLDFGRGESAYERYLGDSNAPHPSLGTVERPPFFALPVHPGAVGTKGGPRTDARARVLRWDGEPVPGLYAAGNAMAAAIGPGTVAGGLTIGSALTFGWIAGRDLGG
jgi:succinate dehydrogenase/fumarate reductase flavoprotein subunit